MLIIVIDKRNKSRFRDVFNMMLTQMAVKQVLSNIIKFFKPIVFSKKKLDIHNSEYADLIHLFDDNQLINNDLNKLIAQIQE